MTCLVSNSHSRIGTRQNAELLRRQAGFALSTAVAIAFSIGGITTEAAAHPTEKESGE